MGKVWVVMCGCHLLSCYYIYIKGRHTRKGTNKKHKPLLFLISLLFHLFTLSGGTEPRVGKGKSKG